MVMRNGFGASGSGATAEDFRRGIQGAFVRNADGSLRAGLIGQTGTVVGSRPSMGVNVASFQAVLAQSNGGALPVQNDGNVVVALAAAPGSNSRIDVVYVKHNDAAGGDANSLPVLAAVTGTAAASPTKPAIPVGALELATVTVPAGATTTQSSGVVISQTFAMTAAAGGVVTLRNAVEQTAFSAVSGQVVRRADLDQLQVAHSTGWQVVPAQTAPTVVMAASGGLARAQHWKTDRMVEIAGNGLKTAGADLFTLPAGSRPGRALTFTDAATPSRSIFVNPGGTVQYSDTANGVTVSFVNVRFLAEG